MKHNQLGLSMLAVLLLLLLLLSFCWMSGYAMKQHEDWTL
jgi:hypothetical protein